MTESQITVTHDKATQVWGPEFIGNSTDLVLCPLRVFQQYGAAFYRQTGDLVTDPSSDVTPKFNWKQPCSVITLPCSDGTGKIGDDCVVLGTISPVPSQPTGSDEAGCQSGLSRRILRPRRAQKENRTKTTRRNLKRKREPSPVHSAPSTSPPSSPPLPPLPARSLSPALCSSAPFVFPPPPPEFDTVPVKKPTSLLRHYLTTTIDLTRM